MNCCEIVRVFQQAKVLAKYKPIVNATFLVSDLQKAERKTARVLEYFKNTRNIVLYYEDIVRNSDVRTRKNF